MNGHLSVELLKTLDENELKRLREFICSPFYNKSETLVKLFDIITKYGPDYTSSKLQKEKLYKKLYPGKNYNEQTIRSRMVEFASLIKEYLSVTGAAQEEFILKRSLIKQYRVKRNYDLADKVVRNELNKLEERKVYDTDYFGDSFIMLDQLAKLYTARDMKSEALTISHKRGEFTLNHFLVNLLQTNDEIIKSGIEQNEKPGFEYVKLFFEKFDFPGFLSTLEAMNYKYYPVLAINYYTNLSLVNPGNEDYFYKLKNLIFTHYKSFTLSEIYNYWSMLSNAAFLGYIKKGANFLREGHEINKFFIENRLYDESKPISAQAYQNTVINALLVKDVDWAEEFIEGFKDKLTEEAKNNRYNYCKAMAEFEKAQYESSLKYLSKVKHANWNFKIGIRMYYLKNYYELGMHEQLTSMLDSFKHFASDNKSLPEYLDDRIKNSLAYISRLAAARFDGKALDYTDLKEAEQSQIFNHKEWILEKMRELLSEA
jgi:hypothetical protein